MFQRSPNLLKQCVCKRTFPNFVRAQSSTNNETYDPKVKSNESVNIAEANNARNTDDVVEVERMGPLTIIGLNRTHKRNAINQQMAFKICEAITNFENDDTSTVGVIHGIGGSFSSGYDIDELQNETLKVEHFINSEGAVVSSND